MLDFFNQFPKSGAVMEMRSKLNINFVKVLIIEEWFIWSFGWFCLV